MIIGFVNKDLQKLSHSPYYGHLFIVVINSKVLSYSPLVSVHQKFHVPKFTCVYAINLNFEVGKISLGLVRSLFCSPRLHLFAQKYRINSDIVKYCYNSLFSLFEYILKYRLIYSSYDKAEFSEDILCKPSHFFTGFFDE